MKRESGEKLTDDRILEAQKFLESNTHRRVSLRETARHSGLSVSRLCHMFKARTGMSPSRFSMHVRMREARALLESGTVSLKEIAARLGFSDQSHFARAFKKAFGVSPSRYRNQRHANARSRRPDEPAEK